MNQRLALLPILVLTLAGCGGHDEKSAPELGGTLHHGAIQGVTWRTPTRSGVTDAGGRFAYLPGETVTFSIGDVALGAAPGAPDITLFTLAGGTPPTTERTLRRELDRAMRLRTPLTRAMNLDLLLIALDADGDPDNGIDVRNRETALRDAGLDFDQRLGDFATQLYTTVPSLIQRVPLFKPLAHLYASLGLRVPVHAQMRNVGDSDPGFPSAVRTFAYAPNGALTAENNDRDGDGTIDWHAGYAYDAFGRVTRFEDSFDFDFDHVDDQRFATNYQFDARGNVLGIVQEQEDVQAGRRETWRLVEHVFDDLGRTLRQVVDYDGDGDGIVDSRQVGVTDFDADTTRAVYTSTTDDGNDGVVDSITRQTERYDKQRRPVSIVVEYDFDANGVIDARDTYTYAHDDVARTMRTTSENDLDGDGTADWRSVVTLQLDRDGNVLARAQSTEQAADGVVTQAESIAREFDDAGRVTQSTRDEDYDGNGTPDSRQSDATQYDDLGNVISTASDYDGDFDGHVDARVDEGSEYGADGELLATARHYDFDGDGLTDIRDAITVENAVVDDGVLLLTNWYFRTRYYSGVQ